MLDAGIVAAAQRFEHYEITAYGSAISFARQLNRNEVARPLPRFTGQSDRMNQNATGVRPHAMEEQSP